VNPVTTGILIGATLGWLIIVAFLSTGCSDFGKYVSEVDATGGMSSDPNNPNYEQVTAGAKFYFRDPSPRRLPNYSKDK